MNVLFRCDAALHIGTGHVMRCLTLANALRAKGAITVFVCREHAGHLATTIKAQGHECHLLPAPSLAITPQPDEALFPPHAGWLGENWQTDLQQTLTISGNRHFDWLVVDHYALDENWERGMRNVAKNIMVIDDLADRQHDCDILLDQTLGRTTNEYHKYVDNRCKVLTGTKYALLRPEFSQWREYSLARRQHSRLNNVLVNMGGIDNTNLTEKILDTLSRSELPANFKITVVMGSTSPYLQQVESFAKRLTIPTEVKVNISNMAEIMANSDLAIGAAGATSWERCCLGLPTLMLVLADNQKQAAISLLKSGSIILVNELNEINSYLSAFSNQPGTLAKMVNAGKQLVDGNGCQKIVFLLMNSLKKTGIDRNEN